MDNCNTPLFCLSISNAFQFYKFYDERKKDFNLLKFQILLELRELFELKNEQLNKMNQEKEGGESSTEEITVQEEEKEEEEHILDMKRL